MSCNAKHRQDYITCQVDEEHEVHMWEGEIPGRDGTWRVGWQLKEDGRIKCSTGERVDEERPVSPANGSTDLEPTNPGLTSPILLRVEDDDDHEN